MNPRLRAGRIAARTAGLQAAAACLLLPWSLPLRVAAAATLTVLVGVTTVRFRGRHLLELTLVRMRFRRRVQRSTGYRPRYPIETVIPGVDTRGHADRAGKRVGLVADGPEWSAILRLDPIPDAVLVDRLGRLLHELARTATAADSLIDVAQLVGWSVPAPPPAGDPLPPGRRPPPGNQPRPDGNLPPGNRPRPAGGPPEVPADRPLARTFWVAVRFRPGLHPAAVAARGGGEQGAIRAIAAATLRLATALRGQGYPLRILDGAELRDELGTSLGLEPPRRSTTGQPLLARSATPGARAKETWRSWSVGALHHACFRLRRPPRRPARLAPLFTLLARPPAVTTCVSICYARDGSGGPEPHQAVVVRVAVPADRNPQVVRRALRRAAAGQRGRLLPMNGEHLTGVRATIPLAATP